MVIATSGGFIASRFWLPKLAEPFVGEPIASERPARQQVIPNRIPEVELPDLDGKPRRLSEWRGRPLLINFWATWCEPCRREIPLLGKLQKQHANQRLQVLGIAIDFREAVARYVKTTPLPYPTLIAEEDMTALEAFGAGTGLPVSVFADAQGRIAAVKTGELSPREASTILALISRVDAGELTISTAQAEIAAELRHLPAN